MSKKLYSEVVSSGSDSEVESGHIGSTSHGSWLLKFQKEDEETALKKAIKLSKVSNSMGNFFCDMSFVSGIFLCIEISYRPDPDVNAPFSLPAGIGCCKNEDFAC